MDACLDMGEICYARKMFDEFPQPNISMCNAIVEGYCKSNMWGDLIELYARMQHAGVSSDCDILSRVLKACSWLQLLEMGGAIHGHILRLGYECDVFVQSGLVSLYAECGSIDDAKRIVSYGLLYGRRSTVVIWTAIISKSARNGCSMDALRLFSDMRRMNVKPDWITLVSVLRACADLDYLEQGKSLHGCVLKMGLESEEDLQISLTAMYAKCGQVMVARCLFNHMDTPNLILWNAMISGYAKNGYAEEAVELFKLLIAKKNIKPDSITVRAAILACAQVGSLDLAKWMNGYVSSSDYSNHVFVKTALIDMYAKCGSLASARQVFNGIRDKDVVVWSAMIVGYGLHGHGYEAINLYYAMKQAQVRPNDVTFLGLLTACKNSCLVKEGWEFFHSMKDYGLEPCNQHYACVVDLLGRAGYLGEAYKFIVRMPIEPGLTVWGALLSACKIHRHVQMGEYAATQLFAIDPYDTGQYVQLSNLYAAARMWDQVNEVRKLMKDRGLSKDFGFSSIEIDGKLQVFRVGDNSHPKSAETWRELVDLERRLKEAGFSPDTESNLHDLSYEDMQESLFALFTSIILRTGTRPESAGPGLVRFSGNITLIGVPNKAEKDQIVKSVMDLKNAEVEEGYTTEAVASRQLDLLMDVKDKLLFEPEYAGDIKEKIPSKSTLRILWAWLPGALCLLEEVGEEKLVLDIGRAGLLYPDAEPHVHDVLLSMALAEIEESLEELAPACTLELLAMPQTPDNA
ncbi:hypothetical protein RDABS01_018499 [Bienertia sinuspersici]